MRYEGGKLITGDENSRYEDDLGSIKVVKEFSAEENNRLKECITCGVKDIMTRAENDHAIRLDSGAPVFSRRLFFVGELVTVRAWYYKLLIGASVDSLYCYNIVGTSTTAAEVSISIQDAYVYVLANGLYDHTHTFMNGLVSRWCKPLSFYV